MSVIFELGATSITLKTYSYPERDSSSRGIVEGRMQGGETIVHRKGAAERVRTLEWENLSDDEAAELRNFYDNVCDGAFRTFQFTDYDSAVYPTVRWLDDWFPFEKVSHNNWAGSITLRIES